MNFLMELRETAKACPKPEVAVQLRYAADDLEAKIKATYFDPSRINVVALNGAWVFAWRVLKNAPPLGGDGVQGGAMPVTEEMRRAA